MGAQTYDNETLQAQVRAEPCILYPDKETKPGRKDGLQVEEDDDDHDGEDAAVLSQETTPGETIKKKRKKRTKAKKSKSNGEPLPTAQSDPPRIPVSKLIKNERYNEGQILLYDITNENNARTSSEETRYLTRFNTMNDTFLNNYRKAAEVHRQVRAWVQRTAKPGTTLTEIAVGIDDGVRALLDNQGLGPGNGLQSGLGFPTGLCLNNCAAHWTPNPGAKDVVLKHSDVLKVDFGVHINGWIVDSAFTMSFDPVYDNLLAAVKDATNTGIQNAGIDARISEISAAIQEAMESYEVELNGKTRPVKAVRNITGHNIGQYKIHAGKHVPFIKNNQTDRMEEGEVFAIETFGSTGTGVLRDEPGVYGYGKRYDAPNVPLSLASARSLLKTINENFGTLVFSRRSLERLGVNRYLLGMNNLVSNGIMESYAPLSDVKGSYTAQFEHTILIRPNCTEVVSRGDDY